MNVYLVLFKSAYCHTWRECGMISMRSSGPDAPDLISQWLFYQIMNENQKLTTLQL